MDIKIQAFNFFFHPCHKSHSELKSALSVVTIIALSVLSLGTYLIPFVAFQCLRNKLLTHEVKIAPEIASATFTTFPVLSLNASALKAKQMAHCILLEKLAAKGQWEHLREHTESEDSAFDWWMFPLTRSSTTYGEKYQLNNEEVRALKKDPVFMESYRKGVLLVASSWGWDLKNEKNITNARQKWTGYQVRLGKMLCSLKLFNEEDLFKSLVKFIDEARLRPSLEKWIRKILKEN